MGLTYKDGAIDLGGSDPITTAVIISLFSDARVTDEEWLAGSSRRGFWGDCLTDGRTGSKLWLLGREKRTPDVLRAYEDYAREALRWLVDDGLAEAIAVTATFPDAQTVFLRVAIDGREITVRSPHAI